MNRKPKYQSILVKRNKGETVRKKIDVAGDLGQVSLVISYD